MPLSAEALKALGAPRFRVGQLLTTPGALELLKRTGEPVLQLLLRHACGDWSELDPEDQAANQAALVHGARVLSSYHLTATERVWIITEADRSSTTFLLPEEY